MITIIIIVSKKLHIFLKIILPFFGIHRYMNPEQNTYKDITYNFTTQLAKPFFEQCVYPLLPEEGITMIHGNIEKNLANMKSVCIMAYLSERKPTPETT